MPNDQSTSQLIPVSDATLAAIEGTAAFRTTRKLLGLRDSQRERAIGWAGWAPYAYPLGCGPTSVITGSIILAINGGTVLIPMWVPAHMKLDGVTIRSADTATARSAEWQLYEDRGDGTSIIQPITGASGTFSFTPTVASTRSSTATGAPVYLEPGLYWLGVRNTGGATNFSFAMGTGGTMILTSVQTATLSSTIVGATIDFQPSVTWNPISGAAGALLAGQVFGQASRF